MLKITDMDGRDLIAQKDIQYHRFLTAYIRARRIPTTRSTGLSVMFKLVEEDFAKVTSTARKP
jgi:hypothetical protein